MVLSIFKKICVHNMYACGNYTFTFHLLVVLSTFETRVGFGFPHKVAGKGEFCNATKMACTIVLKGSSAANPLDH